MKRVLLLALLLVFACQRVEHKADGLPQQAEALVQQARQELDNQHFDAALEAEACYVIGSLYINKNRWSNPIDPEIYRTAGEYLDKGLKETDYVTAAEIAQKLYLSVHTINSHRQRIYAKMEVKNVSEMLHRAAELGIT